MNDAVSRALGRAGELEALVHNEVSTLEQSYEENERKIRGLIQELAGERHALLNTGDRFRDTLSQLGTEVPQLIEKLGHQQLKLATIIEGAGANLSQLETALTGQTNQLESTLDGGAGRLQSVLEDYTGALAVALGSRTDQMQAVLGDYTETMGGHAASMQTALEDQRTNIEKMFADNREVVDTSAKKLDETLSNRTETMQIVFEEYARAMDTMLSNRTDDIDSQLVQRIKALDDAFSERLQLFDETVMKSAMSVDDAIGRNSGALTSALETHARDLGDTLAKQAEQLDHTLATRIEAVRSSSENISKQSIKAIEGLAGQSDLLRTVSENLLSQINNVSNRFENQGQAILQSANALESANVKIDKMLSRRSNELNDTLDLMSSRANELGQAVQGYSSTLEGSVSQAERRARMLTQDLTRQTQERARSTVDDLQRLKDEARKEADRALDDLKSEFATVSREVTERLGSLSSQFSQTTGEVRAQAARAAQQLEDEQGRLRQQMERLPGATEESAAAMRKALRDQLKALDQLSSLAVRTAHESAASPPVNQQPIPLQEAPPPQEHGDRGDTAATSRDANSLTNTLQRELHQPHAPDVTRSATNGTPRESTPRRAVASLAGDKGERSGEDGKWSFGDLLARASDEDPQAVPAEPREAQSSPDSDGGLDIAAIAGALDRTTAAAIWTRFRSGQRGFMVRSIYAHDSRELYDDVVYRYQYKPAFRENVNRFLLEFEQVLRDLDRQDGSGELTQEHIIADTGRVYLLLAHAAKRLV
ncbi:MAG: hypothetical protein ACR2PA_17515, partial [Hyphomicrobiaceae bacterium]